MRHFQQLTDEQTAHLFHRAPSPFGRGSDPAQLALALGATLYCPAVRPDLAAAISRRYRQDGVLSVVCCLEDSIRDDEVEQGERNLVEQLTTLAAAEEDGPLAFIRVRDPRQISVLCAQLGDALRVVSGFVLPKFRADDTGRAYLAAVRAASIAAGRRLYAMPVLETPDLVQIQTRIGTLSGIRALLGEYPDEVLAVRVGATDMSGWYGLRRPADLTIWDLRVVADALADIINILGVADGTGYTVTGPVWEYFQGERMFKPLLRTSPFAEHAPDALPLRRLLLDKAMDGLIRETVLDRANGFTGKTVIHPSHAPAVHALTVVTHEEYVDAAAICADVAVAGGVLRSQYANKMNETKPHRAWARRTLARAEAFGVAHEDITFVDFLEACVASEPRPAHNAAVIQ